MFLYKKDSYILFCLILFIYELLIIFSYSFLFLIVGVSNYGIPFQHYLTPLCKYKTVF